MQPWLTGLNSEQKLAATSTEGHVRVLAGPGTGKTRALTSRYCYLTETLGVPPRNILCVTFTNKAANEMKQRIRGWLGDLDLGYICTLHAFCVQFLKEEIHALHYPKNFIILDVEDQRTLLLKIFEDMGLSLREATIKQKIDEVLEARKMTADAYVNEIFTLDNTQLEERIKATTDINDGIFFRYLYEQKKNFACDFNDLINFTAYILKHFPDVLQKWQERIQYVMVDEFQDVSAKQYSIAQMLSGKHGNLFIVGDPDQTIYTWRNAHVKLFLDFDKVYPDAKTIVLSTNYRSSPEILKAAEALIEKNVIRYPKTLTATLPNGPRTLYFHARTEKEEADWIADEISKLLAAGESPDRIAVLYRSHFLSRSIEDSFLRHTIAYKIYSGIEFYSRAEIKDCVAYLRMLTAADDVAFLRTINSPSRKIGKKKLAFLKSVAAAENLSLYESLKRTAHEDIFKGTDVKKYILAIETVKKEIHSLPLGSLFQKVLDLSGYENYLRLQSDQERLDNVAELKRAVDEAGEDPDATLEEFLSKVALLSNVDQKDKRQAVKLMTIHSAKGMEFPYVFVCGLNEGVFPSYRIQSKKEMEEERRVAFVALTRAENGLFLSNSEEDVQGAPPLMMSRFVLEMDLKRLNCSGEISQEYLKTSEEYIIQMKAKEERPAQQPGEPAAQEAFRPGQAVLHPAFGKGKIRNITQEAYLVDFESGKSRSIAKTYPLKPCPSPDGKAGTSGK